MEIWKDIQDYEGRYQISDKGRVRSLDRYIDTKNQWRNYRQFYKGVIMNPTLHPNGYYRVDLKNRRLHSIARLVAYAFISNLENKKEVNHINGIKTDNRVVNLEWATRSENVRHADRTGLRVFPKGKDHWGSKKIGKLNHKSKPVKDLSNGKIYESISDAATDLKIPNLHAMLRGDRNNSSFIRYI